MQVELTKKDLINLICGREPGYKDITRLENMKVGHFTGGFAERWSWDKYGLEKLSEQDLLNLYRSF